MKCPATEFPLQQKARLTKQLNKAFYCLGAGLKEDKELINALKKPDEPTQIVPTALEENRTNEFIDPALMTE